MLIAFTDSVTLFVKAILGVKVRNVPILASDGRTLIVAMDHARTHGAIDGLEDFFIPSKTPSSWGLMR